MRRTGFLVAVVMSVLGANRPVEAQPVYTPYYFATYAGIYGNASGPTLALRLNNPVGIAIDGGGNMFVSEQGTNSDLVIMAACKAQPRSGGSTG